MKRKTHGKLNLLKNKIAQIVSSVGLAKPIFLVRLQEFVGCHEMAATRQRAEHVDEGKH